MGKQGNITSPGLTQYFLQGLIPGGGWVQLGVESAAGEELFTRDGVNWSVFPKAAQNTVVAAIDDTILHFEELRQRSIRGCDRSTPLGQFQIVHNFRDGQQYIHTFTVGKEMCSFDPKGNYIAPEAIVGICRSIEADDNGDYWARVDLRNPSSGNVTGRCFPLAPFRFDDGTKREMAYEGLTLEQELAIARHLGLHIQFISRRAETKTPAGATTVELVPVPSPRRKP